MNRRWQLFAVTAAVVAAVPTAALGAERMDLPPWMARVMGEAPPEMQRHMDTPEMQQMMVWPEMRRMMDAASLEQIEIMPTRPSEMMDDSPSRAR